MVVEKYLNVKPEIVLVQSDLFKDVSYIKLEELVKDDSVMSLFAKGDRCDIDFKIALFYSDLSIVILKKSRGQKALQKYVDDLYKKSLEKWDNLIKKDDSMLFFKNYYLNSYKTELESKTNLK